MQINLSIWLLAFAVIFFAKRVESVLVKDIVEVEKTYAHAEDGEIKLNYRLPNESYPEHYGIKLTTYVHKGEQFFQGEVTIDIVFAKSTNNIVLHARQLAISKVTIVNANTVNGESEELFNEYELEREFLTLTRKNYQQFAAKTKWKLTISYNGKLRDDLEGFQLSKYQDEAGNSHYLAATHFGSTGARHAFPCYDEPDKLANFTITIHHSPTYTAISNIPHNYALSSASKTVFLTTTRMPTYTVALVVSDFEYTEGSLNGLPQRVYSRPGTKNEHKFALFSGMLIADHLIEHYGIGLMLPQILHVAIPGAIENWSMITHPEISLLYNENTSKVHSQNIIAIDVAHQIARQWFGGYVTIKWWTYLWLKEGFATLVSYRALDHAYPEWDIWQEFHAMVYQAALKNDVDNFSTPSPIYVQKPMEISSLYDNLSNCKHAAVLLMWNNALTDNVFRQGFRNFMLKNQNTAVEEEQFFTAIQTAVEEENYQIPATISEMIGTWTHQSGYPILTVTRNYDDGTFTVQQGAFNDNETLKSAKTWYVPFNYAVASNPDFRETEATHYLLNVTEMKVDDVEICKKDWLLLNKQSTGYYRINYDAENWNLIAKSLIDRPFSIHCRNRAQLIDDSQRLSASNRLDHAIHLKLLSYLKQEDQLAPWNTALFILENYNRYLRGDEKYGDFKFFVAEQVRPIYKKLGINEIPGERHNDKFTRILITYIACIVGVQECLDQTNNKLKDHFYKNTTIEPNLVDNIYAFGLRQSSDDVFNLVYQKLMTSTDKYSRSLLINYMGYAQNENQIKKFINSSIDESNNLWSDERCTLLRRTYSKGGLSLLACVEFLSLNWNVYGNLKKNDSNPLHDDILGMASYVANKNEEKKLLALVAKVKNSKHVLASLETDVKQKIADNFQWLRQHREPIMAWMSQYRADNDNGGSTCPTIATSTSTRPAT